MLTENGPRDGGPTDVVSLLADMVRADPGRPRLTWYGPDGERVELSGKVLANWIAKTSNLLVDELDAGPGSTVALDLPAHWRSVVWLLAVWAVGAHAGLGPRVAADVLVTATPATAPAGRARLVAVALPALATSFARATGVPPPPGALDAAAEVRLQPDAFLPLAAPAPGDPAFTVSGTTTSHSDLLATARRLASQIGVRPGDRLLTGAGADRALPAWLGPLALGGSVVLHHDLGSLDDAARQRLSAQEAVSRIA